MFKTVIGLEIHVQLKTKSKMFCGCDNNAEEAAPNTLVCPVCLGLPGVLPVANRQAIEWTIKTGLALDAKISEVSKFDRKHYFYPDLPKNYQISQFDLPFVTGGKLEILNEKSDKKTINLTRIHLEEDAGKLIHHDDATLIDLNRAGTPLMEIVSEPEISSPTEAKIFMQELRAILRYLSVSDANMEKGHLRCDANISITEIQNPNDETRMGTPVEIKNLNSFKMVERALAYEEKRQKEMLERGERVVKETRGWNDTKGETYPQRSKELAQDYRYFPEPDIPPFNIKSFDIEYIKASIPELPAEKRKRYVEDFKLSPQDTVLISSDQAMANFFEKVASGVTPKIAANWIINELNTEQITKISSEKLVELLKKVEKNEITSIMAKEVMGEVLRTGKSPQEIIDEKGFKNITDEGEISKVVQEVISENPKPVQDFKAGKNEAIGFLLGQVMKKTKGQADPNTISKILQERIKNE